MQIPAQLRTLSSNYDSNHSQDSNLPGAGSPLDYSNQLVHSNDLPNPLINQATSLKVPIEPLNLEQVIQNHVRRVLDLNRGNKLRSARQLGISRSTLYRILASKMFSPR